MYYYVYDSFVKKDKQAERILQKVNIRLTELDMLGETAEVNKIRDMRRLIQEGIDKGHSTIVIVGDDSSLNRAANCVLGKKEVVLGTIPVGRNISLARSLGLDNPEQIADILVARKVEQLDLGVVNNQVFLGSLECGIRTSKQERNGNSTGGLRGKLLNLQSLLTSRGRRMMKIRFDIDRKYHATALTRHCSIVNLRTFGGGAGLKSKINTCSNNEELDLVVLDNLSRSLLYRYSTAVNNGNYEDVPHTSFIQGYRFKITCDYRIDLWADGQQIGRTPAEVGVIPKELRMIVGKQRMF